MRACVVLAGRSWRRGCAVPGCLTQAGPPARHPSPPNPLPTPLAPSPKTRATPAEVDEARHATAKAVRAAASATLRAALPAAALLDDLPAALAPTKLDAARAAIADCGRRMYMLSLLRLVWNADLALELLSQNYETGLACVGDDDAPLNRLDEVVAKMGVTREVRGCGVGGGGECSTVANLAMPPKPPPHPPPPPRQQALLYLDNMHLMKTRAQRVCQERAVLAQQLAAITSQAPPALSSQRRAATGSTTTAAITATTDTTDTAATVQPTAANGGALPSSSADGVSNAVMVASASGSWLSEGAEGSGGGGGGSCIGRVSGTSDTGSVGAAAAPAAAFDPAPAGEGEESGGEAAGSAGVDGGAGPGDAVSNVSPEKLVEQLSLNALHERGILVSHLMVGGAGGDGGSGGGGWWR